MVFAQRKRCRGFAAIALVCMLIIGFQVEFVAAQTIEPMTDASDSKSGFSWKAEFGKSPATFTPDEWAPIIDARWGAGLPTEQKLELFDTWFTEIEQRFGVFHNADIDLEALRSRYRPEIEQGVSRGRMVAIMTHFTYQLQEMHTYIYNVPIRSMPISKGTPTLVIGQWGTNRQFGALLTPLPDSSLLVYEAVPNHPLGLEAGDIVLGYDGELWKDIYPRLLEAELPLFLNSVNGSTEESNYYYAMQAAGLNWHLFDTIDIKKYGSEEVRHLGTNLLANMNQTLWGKEQIAPPGVPWPNRSTGKRVGWGVIEGTNVGLITVTSWSFEAQYDIRNQFRSAVQQMMQSLDVDGIIFDFRFNTGGGALATDGLQLLFNQTVPTVGFDQRVPGSSDYLQMEPDPKRNAANLVIQGLSDSFFDKPIAILIGPGSISAGELEARRLSFHPRARIFGLPAPGGNTGSDFVSIGDNDWYVSRSHSAQYLVSNHEYLSHKGLQPHERVWFEQADVANGIDTVIEAARSWIESETSSSADPGADSDQGLDVHWYPNPFRTQVAMTIALDAQRDVLIELYTVLGRRVATLFDAPVDSGRHTFRIDGDDLERLTLGSGIYLWTATAGGERQSGTVAFVR